MWLRFCGQVFKSIFVPKGLQDSSLTPGTDKKGTRPEGGGVEAFSVLECRTRSAANFCRPFRAGPIFNVSWG